VRRLESLAVAEEAAARLKRLVPEYAVLVNAEKSVMLKLAGGEPSVVQSWSGYEVTVYAASEPRIMVSSFSARDAAEAAEKAAGLVERLEPSPLYAPLPEPSGSSYEIVDSALEEMAHSGDISRLVDDLELEVVGDAAGMVLVAYRERGLVTSRGARLEGRVTEFNGYVRVFRGEEASGQWSWVSTAYDAALARRAIDVAKSLADECAGLPRDRVEPGEYRVLLSPMVAGNLLETVLYAASAGSVFFGHSFFTRESVGERVASESLTLVDAPRAGRLPGYAGFDDEGVATRDKAVIKAGALETLLHNSKTARLFGVETTGNAGLLLPRPFNMIVAPGSLSPGDMLEALGDGIYVTNNWYTRFQNIAEGLFSTVARDATLVVKRGRPTACAPRLRLTGSMRDLIANIEDLGAEQWPIRWWEVRVPSLLPHALISKIGVTSE